MEKDHRRTVHWSREDLGARAEGWMGGRGEQGHLGDIGKYQRIQCKTLRNPFFAIWYDFVRDWPTRQWPTAHKNLERARE
jgi:hypothetical protein